MSVLPSDIVVYGSANMPEVDGAITGGSVDFTRRIAFYDPPATSTSSRARPATPRPRSLITAVTRPV